MHGSIRNYYLWIFERQTIKNKKEKEKEQGKKQKFQKDFYTQMAWAIPKDADDLVAKITNKHQHKIDNQNINANIRLGKIIHYTGINASKQEIENSPYWTSSKQAYIKSAEAFVKSWFNFVTFGNHTLAYLLENQDYKPDKDILGGADKLKINDEKTVFDKATFSKKIGTILGNEHHFEHLIHPLINFFRYKLYAIRNKITHYHELKKVFDILKEPSVGSNFTDNGLIKNDNFYQAIKLFAENDLKKQQEILWQSFQAVGILDYMDNAQDVDKFWQAVTLPVCETSVHTKINLPKFNKILKRAEGIGAKIMTSPKAGENETGEFACQYLCLKTLYDKPFQVWIQALWGDHLKAYIEQAKNRINKASEDLNGFSSAVCDFPTTYENLNAYMFELTKQETMRGSMQNGYQSNQKAQKKKSGAIENFKMEVLIYAFKDYLKQSRFDYLERGLSGVNKKIAYMPKFQHQTFEDWQAELYLLLHLVPVGVACDLEHQMNKYYLMQDKNNHASEMSESLDRKSLHQIFAVYRQSNDIKHCGTADNVHHTDIFAFYENGANDYSRIFQKNASDNMLKANVQHRHIREFVRFGIGQYMKEVSKNHKIKTSEIDKWLAFDAKIVEKNHKDLAKLHDDWVKKRNKFSDQDKEAYQNLLKQVNDYRTLDNHVKLVDFRKLHKLVMQLLARFAGYAFMYERDLYFMVLAYCYQENKTIEAFFDEPKLGKDLQKHCKYTEKFLDGQVIFSLSQNKDILNRYPSLLEMLNPSKKNPRNDFAHFNMLRQDALNITDCMNNARIMMSYDRKLKNAVAKSVRTILEKEKITIDFSVACGKQAGHELKCDALTSQQAYHLGTKKEDSHAIAEALHSGTYIAMVKEIFKPKET